MPPLFEGRKAVERVKGIEPSYPAWEAGVLLTLSPQALETDTISVSLESVSRNSKTDCLPSFL